MSYKYIHNDGSEGTGLSTWAAIVDALGRDSAYRLNMRDPVWDYVNADGVEKQSTLESEDGETLGILQKLETFP